jgi:hypothetical protein
MLGTHFYNETIRKTIVGFGTLFNNIELQRKDNNGDIKQTMKVPLAYGPREKFLARIESQPDLLENSKSQITLPRMAFEMNGISYDNTRKTNTVTVLKATGANSSSVKTQYVPVPYNLDFELSIIGKNNDDVIQIVEQILPYFQPTFTLTINMNNEMGDKKDIPITLNNINIQDDYEGDFIKRRSLVYILNFTAKTYFYGPVSATDGIIKQVNVDYYTNLNASTREVRYRVEPAALQDYNNDGNTFNAATAVNVNSNTITLNNHGFITGDFVQYRDGGATAIGGLTDEGTYYVVKIDDNSFRLATSKLNANQGYYVDITSAGSGTTHKISAINAVDDDLVEADDNFGFNEEWL